MKTRPNPPAWEYGAWLSLFVVLCILLFLWANAPPENIL